MIVSWNWLKEYVRLDMPVEVLTERLMMAGLNLEEVADVDGDMAIDLEVTSNRPDCLSHLGIAREVGVLFDRGLQAPAARPVDKGPPTASLTSVENRMPDLCPQYIARLVADVKVGPSPEWMRRRLANARHPADQQRRRHHQLRAHGVRSAAARLRLRQARRAQDRRPPGRAGRKNHRHRPAAVRADSRRCA